MSPPGLAEAPGTNVLGLLKTFSWPFFNLRSFSFPFSVLLPSFQPFEVLFPLQTASVTAPGLVSLDGLGPLSLPLSVACLCPWLSMAPLSLRVVLKADEGQA